MIQDKMPWGMCLSLVCWFWGLVIQAVYANLYQGGSDVLAYSFCGFLPFLIWLGITFYSFSQILRICFHCKNSCLRFKWATMFYIVDLIIDFRLSLPWQLCMVIIYGFTILLASTPRVDSWCAGFRAEMSKNTLCGGIVIFIGMLLFIQVSVEWLLLRVACRDVAESVPTRLIFRQEPDGSGQFFSW